MKSVIMSIMAGAMLILTGGCVDMNQKTNIENEKKIIEKVIKSSIGWAANKDMDLLYSCFAKDEDLFYFSPRDDGTIHGYKAFTELTEGFFMKEEFKAIGFKVKDLNITLSRSGDVAWYHARLDDYNEWQGQPANWEDVRWTGVLEKRDGQWVIVQMHFSSPTDRAEAETTSGS